MIEPHDIAHPRLKPRPSNAEIRKHHRVTPIELAWVCQHTRASSSRLGLLALLKTFQRLGDFLQLEDRPKAVLQYLARTYLPNITFVTAATAVLAIITFPTRTLPCSRGSFLAGCTKGFTFLTPYSRIKATCSLTPYTVTHTGRAKPSLDCQPSLELKSCHACGIEKT
jgi:hypothetical protein